MRSFTIAVLSLLVFSSCETFHGQLNVKKSFKALDDKKNQMKEIPEGFFSASIEGIAKDKIKLKIDGVHDKGIVLDLGQKKIKQLQQPEFDIPANTMAQEFGLVGYNESHTDYSDMVSSTESCTLYKDVRSCERVCNVSPSGEKRCHKECHIKTISMDGYKHVEFQYVTTTNSVNVKFMDPNHKDVIATFNGSYSDQSKSYHFIGECRRY